MIAETDFSMPFYMFFAEIFGVTDAPHGYILDNGRSGFIGTLATIDAARASATAEGKQATIAAHVNHVLFILNQFLSIERGEAPNEDWASSWSVQVVDDAAWDALRGDLQAAYDALVDGMKARAELPPPAVGALMQTLTHCAYHLGEIRQRLLWVGTN